jgi:hypothetical protein
MEPDQLLNKNALSKAIIHMYKFLTSKEFKPVYDKSQTEIMEEIMETNISLDTDLGKKDNLLESFVKRCQKESEEIQKANHQFERKLRMFPAFCDYCFSYYIILHGIIEFRHIPASLAAFEFITARFATKHIKEQFLTLMKESIFSDLQIEEPPYLLRTEMELKDVKEHFNNLMKKMKLLVCDLIKLDTQLAVNLDDPEKDILDRIKPEVKKQ